MNLPRRHITVFEHEKIRLGQQFCVHSSKKVVFDEFALKTLQQHYGETGVPYYSLIHQGVQFNEHVGVIQVGNLLIEVLPKADKGFHSESEDTKWRDMLINMMRSVGSFDIRVTSNASLRIKPNTILDLYIENFLNEVDYLLHSGLVKKYRKTESNKTSLKGILMFGKHLQLNLTHQERFYVRHTVYDIEHLLHLILYSALKLVRQINTNDLLHGRIGALFLCFPEMPSIEVSESTFKGITFNRKTEGYRVAIEIARMLILQYHPDISKGQNNVLALMFDMNLLWEKFIFNSLRKYSKGVKVSAQVSKDFWKPEHGSLTRIRPDIVIETNGITYVLDTKWKNLNTYNPSPDDLRQMYVYHEYFAAVKTALVYPGDGIQIKGIYRNLNSQLLDNMQCYVLPIAVDANDISVWQEKIATRVGKWLCDT